MLGKFTFGGGRREGKTELAAMERDFALQRGETVIIASPKKGGGIHFCTIKSFAREKLRRTKASQ